MTTRLPPPHTSGGLGLHAAIARRRSLREWSGGPLTAAELSQLLWAAQGVTGPDGERAVPSPGDLYPLVLHVLTEEGVHRYLPEDHRLEPVVGEDRRASLAHACLEQQFVADAPVVLVLANRRRLSRGRYGARAERYAMLEAGCAAENVLLEAVALGLAGVPVGAFYDVEVHRDAGFAPDEAPLYVLPLGRVSR
jgi:SagB-type dehydrogenase family enzyme